MNYRSVLFRLNPSQQSCRKIMASLLHGVEFLWPHHRRGLPPERLIGYSSKHHFFKEVCKVCFSLYYIWTNPWWNILHVFVYTRQQNRKLRIAPKSLEYKHNKILYELEIHVSEKGWSPIIFLLNQYIHTYSVYIYICTVYYCKLIILISLFCGSYILTPILG